MVALADVVVEGAKLTVAVSVAAAASGCDPEEDIASVSYVLGLSPIVFEPPVSFEHVTFAIFHPFPSRLVVVSAYYNFLRPGRMALIVQRVLSTPTWH